jgi:hypothetical protein
VGGQAQQPHLARPNGEPILALHQRLRWVLNPCGSCQPWGCQVGAEVEVDALPPRCMLPLYCRRWVGAEDHGGGHSCGQLAAKRQRRSFSW